MIDKLQKALAVGFIGGLGCGGAMLLFGGVTGIDLIHPDRGLKAVASLFLPAILTGYYVQSGVK